MMRIGIILGSTRPNRNGDQVHDTASRRRDVAFELIDRRERPQLDWARTGRTASTSHRHLGIGPLGIGRHGQPR
jgi:hypothetical protein